MRLTGLTFNDLKTFQNSRFEELLALKQQKQDFTENMASPEAFKFNKLDTDEIKNQLSVAGEMVKQIERYENSKETNPNLDGFFEWLINRYRNGSWYFRQRTSLNMPEARKCDTLLNSTLIMKESMEEQQEIQRQIKERMSLEEILVPDFTDTSFYEE